ncbi:YdeI/OmpD-associated family protein [Curtobacterium sp. ME12]|uniref:YdeI/OmpD-associated family protein n=1 Tax=Curtobacterium sp. ME12 TaxID=2744253 RepID=UPI0015F58948|nr:YdeI/OmpD-associated family protein [Curtobacterium sp. ME12]
MDIVDLVLPDTAAWRAWLDDHEHEPDGVWLVLAKKGVTEPTTLTYDTALDEALCSGWIDGQRRGRDDTTYRQRFTPRRKASLWSQRNLGLVAALVAEGRMRERGHAEIERAKADGRWDRAYAGSATATVPEDLQTALDAAPAAAALFAELDATNRYAVLHRITTAPNATVRTNRLTKLVGGLERGETPYPRPTRPETPANPGSGRGTPTQRPATHRA